MTKKKYTSGYLAIENDRGLKGVFTTLGAGVYSLTLHGKPLILQPVDRQVYLSSNQYFGKTMGRVIGRLKKDVKILGKECDLLAGKDGICLHGGGEKSLSFRDFSGIVFSEGDYNGVMFNYISPDGECGFPGELDVKITYLIPLSSNELIIKQEATTTKETIISLSNHIYWNIFPDIDVNAYRLMIAATHCGTLQKQSELVVNTRVVPDYLDFTEGARLKDKLDAIKKHPGEPGTLDHPFLFDQKEPTEPKVVLDTPRMKIECYTDYDGVNVYVDVTDTPVKFANGPVKGRRAIAIEPQLFPTEKRILRPGEVYRHVMRYRILEK